MNLKWNLGIWIQNWKFSKTCITLLYRGTWNALVLVPTLKIFGLNLGIWMFSDASYFPKGWVSSRTGEKKAKKKKLDVAYRPEAQGSKNSGDVKTVTKYI